MITRFWRRKYLIEPKVQIEITFYLLLFLLILLGFIYASVRFGIDSIFLEALRVGAGCGPVFEDSQRNIHIILKTIFLVYGVLCVGAGVVGGILLTHRVVGPIYRIRHVLAKLNSWPTRRLVRLVSLKV